MLSELDSAIGDGDHGTTMLRAVNQLESVIRDHQALNPSQFLDKIAWTLLGIDGGATGPLLGTFFLGMSEAIPHAPSLTNTDLVLMFEGGLAALKKQTKAQLGDKTLMDALIPAVTASRQALSEGKEISQLLQEAADSAETGAVATKNLVARLGRARHLGTKTVGHQDPGATSLSLLFRGFYEGFSKQPGD